jgi:polyphenol oxidase
MNIREIRLAPAGDAPYATLAALEAGDGVRLCAGISFAAAGDMALSRRFSHPFRARLLEELGVPPGKAFAVRQVHSRSVVVVGDEQPEELASREADGMITGRPDAFLSVTVADCLPIFLVDRATGAFGVVHSGWKGTGIAREALRGMGVAFGTRAVDIAAVIGPGIGACCYAVPEERAAGFAAQFGLGAVRRAAGEEPRLDLRRANIGVLRAEGVTDISVVTDCTRCTPFLGSFRRQGAADFTLMLAFIGRVPHPRGG